MKHLARTLTLLALAAMLLAGCADTADTGNTLGTNATTPPVTIGTVTTVSRDTLTNPDASADRVALLNSVWAAVKDTVGEELTINNLMVGSFYVQSDNAYICFYLGCRKDGTITVAPMLSKDTVEGYEFRYTDTTKLTVFENGRSYSLQGAYSAGVLTEEELRTVWEAYKAEYPRIYDSDEWDYVKG
ncbi:MAG: hypothetical protein IJX76_08750 [Clostridia bacterium]|nr:hypothetical protein [Clostridia bacterium]